MDIKNFAINNTPLLEQQIYNLAKSDAYKNSIIRMMPDSHPGNTSPVGLTATINGRISPETIGPDIGCTITATLLPVSVKLATSKDFLRQLDDAITSIPIQVSNKNYKYLKPMACDNYINRTKANATLCTLGNGNHFIEVGVVDESDEVYLFIHSGSRNLGAQVYKYYELEAKKYGTELSRAYNEIIQETIKKMKTEGRQREISEYLLRARKNMPNFTNNFPYLEGDKYFQYLYDMQVCIEFAYYNHQLIADQICSMLGIDFSGFECYCVHNYVDNDDHILRKGAIKAKYPWETCLIPLNMRDGIAFVHPRGEKDWNYSLPHGAGRSMSRKEAKQEFTIEEYAATMMGIYSSTIGEETLDEIPMAYNDSQEILMAISEVADVLAVARPIYSYKG